MKRIIEKTKNHISYQLTKFCVEHQDLVKPVLIAGMSPLLFMNNVSAAANIDGAIKVMVGYVTSVIAGVGIIYALVAIFNWVSAIKQEDAERQSKSITNVFVAGLLIMIKPISAAIIDALGGSSGNYGLS